MNIVITTLIVIATVYLGAMAIYLAYLIICAPFWLLGRIYDAYWHWIDYGRKT